jgi:lipoprotein NlpI
LAALDLTKWPASLIDAYLGKGEYEAVFAAAKNPDTATETYQLCDANFYLAELALLDGDRQRARDLFEEAGKVCPTDVLERYMVSAELERLTKAN